MITRSKVARSRVNARSGGWHGWGAYFSRQFTAESNLDTKRYTVDKAVQIAPVTAAVSILGNTAASSELVVERMNSRGLWEKHTERLPLWADPMRQPNPWQTQHEFLFNLVANWMVAGNGYVLVQGRNWYGEWPNQIVSVPHRLVSVNVQGVTQSMAERSRAIRNGTSPTIPGYGGIDDELTYHVDGFHTLRAYTALNAPEGDVMHIRYFTREDIVYGQSPLHWASPPIRTALAADAYAELGLLQGYFPPGILFAKGKGDNKEMEDAKRYINKAMADPSNRFSPMLSNGDWDYVQTLVKPEDLQLMDARKLSWSEVSSIFGVPRELMGAPDTSVSGTGIRNLQRAFAQMTAIPLLNRLGGYLGQLLPPGYRVRLVPHHLLEMDELERSRVEDRLIRAGILLPSEVRRERGLPSLGDDHDKAVCDKLWGTEGGADGGDSDSGRDETAPNERTTNEDGGV